MKGFIMKKILCFALLAGIVASAMAGQLSLTSTTGPYTFELVDTITAVKSVTGTASDTLFKNVAAKWGYGYALQVYDSIVSDSVAIKVDTRVTSGGGIYGQSVADNVSSADATNPYVCVDLGVGNVVAGNYFTVYMTGLNVTTVKKIKRAALWRYKKLTWSIPYNYKP